MKINTKIRIKCVKRKLKHLNILELQACPWTGEDYKYYLEIEYWEEKLKQLKKIRK